VLDRVNPIGGEVVEGPMLEGPSDFVAFHPLPIRHGKTVGELAELFRRERKIDVDLTVIPVKGWQREQWQDEAGLPWVNTSPNIRSLQAAALYPGLGLLDISSDRGPTRAVGELAGEIDPELGLPTLTGFENHGGRTHVGPGARPLARVSVGVGNDGTTEGAYSGSVLGTYSHGPALSRNPGLADLLLRWATGADDLPALDDSWPDRLRGERLAATGAA